MASLSEALSVGLDHYFAGRKAEAEIIFGRILDAAPDHPQALHMAGVLAGERGAFIEAAALLGKAAALTPADADLARNHIRALEAAGREEAAAAAWARALALFPGEASAVAATAQAARRRGAAAAAYRLQRRLARLTTMASDLSVLADDADDAGMKDAAAAACRALLTLAPGHADAWAHMAVNDYADAPQPAKQWLKRAWLGRALQIAPDRPAWRKALWEARRSAGLDAAYHSHEGQDAFVHQTFFPRLRNGVFVDIGAYDGVTWSNSLFFERELGWRGLCVEASPRRYALYRQSGRHAPCVNVAVGDRDGEAQFLDVVSGLTMMNGLLENLAPSQRAFIAESGSPTEVVTVPLRRLDGLLREHGLTSVDFLTLDVEGAEAAILQSFDLDAFAVQVICLESRLPDPALRRNLAARGFDFVCRFEGGDEIFARRGLPRYG